MNPKGLGVVIVLLSGFIALTAIGGGIALLVGAEAERFPPEWLVGTPFKDYTIPALLLAVVVGGSSLLACIASLFRHRLSAWAAMAAGLIMIGYISIEVLILNQLPPGPTVTEYVYFVLGWALFLAGLRMQSLRPSTLRAPRE